MLVHMYVITFRKGSLMLVHMCVITFRKGFPNASSHVCDYL